MSFASVEKSLASSSVITSGLVSFFPLLTAGFIAYQTTARKHLTRTIYRERFILAHSTKVSVQHGEEGTKEHGMVARKQRQRTDREHRKGPEQDRPLPKTQPQLLTSSTPHLTLHHIATIPHIINPSQGGDPAGAQSLRPHHLWKCLTAPPKVDLLRCLLICSG